MTERFTSPILRPGCWALALCLVTAMFAPALLRPATAQAVPNPCDLAVVGAVCDGAADIAKGVADGASTVVDGVKWIEKGAGKILGGVWKATTPFLRAAAAAGLVVSTAVVCSKAAKALAAGTAAVAAAPETAGAGSAPAAAAGAAGVTAMCTLLHKGGKLALKIVSKGSGKLAKLAKLAAAATGLAALVLGTQHAAAWILQRALVVDAPSAPNLGSTWVTDIRRQLNGVAGVLLIVAAMVGLMFSGFTGRTSDVGRILTGMVGAALVIGIVGSLLFASLQLSDRVTTGAVDSAWGQRALGNWTDLGDSYADASPTTDHDEGATTTGDPDGGGAEDQAGAGTPSDDGKGPWVLRFVIAVVTVFAGALVWVELQIRDALLELLLVFSGLLLAGYAFEHLRHLAKGFAMTLLGVVVAKPILVVTLLLGGAQMQNAARTQALLPLLTGAGLMLLAGVLGFRVITWMGFQGHLVDAGAMRLRGGMGGGGFGGRSGGGRPGPREGTDSDGDRPGGGPSGEAGAARQMSRAASSRAAGEQGPATAMTAAGLAAATVGDQGRSTGPTSPGAGAEASGADVSAARAAGVAGTGGSDSAGGLDGPGDTGSSDARPSDRAMAGATRGASDENPAPGLTSGGAITDGGVRSRLEDASGADPTVATPGAPPTSPGPAVDASPPSGLGGQQVPAATTPATGPPLHATQNPTATNTAPAGPRPDDLHPADALGSQAARTESLLNAVPLRRSRPGGAAE